MSKEDLELDSPIKVQDIERCNKHIKSDVIIKIIVIALILSLILDKVSILLSSILLVSLAIYILIVFNVLSEGFFGRIFTFLKNHGIDLLINLVLGIVVKALLFDALPLALPFLSGIWRDISCNNAKDVLYMYISIPLILGLSLKYLLLLAQTDDSHSINKKKERIFRKAFLLIIRIILVIISGAMLSNAFNSDIANETNNSSLSLNTTQVNDEEAKQQCDAKPKFNSGRLNYLMLVMLYVGYEGFTPEMEKRLKKKSNKKENIEEDDQIVQGDLTEEP
ncbi:hypothetical protein [Abiotrophia defectiva]|uniref:hypothetical protein n=1 Tax=Abiotrophia defectiva TaxID=46125 RepID=UPI003C72AB0F